MFSLEILALALILDPKTCRLGNWLEAIFQSVDIQYLTRSGHL